MSKHCWICGQKLNMMNSVLFNNVTICEECRDLYNSMLFSQTKFELENKKSDLLSRVSNNPDAEEFIKESGKKAALEIGTTEEKEEEQKRQYEEARKEKERLKEERQKIYEEEQERQRKEQEDRDAFLKENGHEGYYEYKILNIIDDYTGSVNIVEISEQLNILGRQGWHLKCAYTNEIGRNASSFGLGGVSSGTNSTVDQSILILERFIKFK